VTAPPLLELRDLRVRFPGSHGPLEVVRGVSFAMGRERLGILGESGSGKSLTGRAVIGLLPPRAQLSAARLAFDGTDLLAAGAAAWRRLRGRRIGLVLQDPRQALNPVMSIGGQIAESFRTHAGLSRREARERALDMLEAVRIRAPRRVYDLHPHELSGGMAQRAMLAMMLAPDPELLIADEPTSALDATVQMEILTLLDELVARRGMGIVFIGHDIDTVAGFCDRVLVMQAGRVVEDCAARDLEAARHPYTRRLLAARPRLEAP
jgi:peptide/nickel transport system ATP-binding protein